MRRLLSLLCVLALVASAAAVAACGGDDGDGDFTVSAAEAADATRAADAAKVDLTARVTGAGLPLPLTLKAQGVAATGTPKLDVTFDFGQLLALAGQGGDGKTRVVLDGGHVYVDPPALERLELPGGARWVTADIGKVLESLDVDPSGFGELLRLSPDQQVAALKAAGTVKEVGQEKLDGVQTVHLRGTVTTSDYLKALPADRRSAAQRALKELEKLPGGAAAELDKPAPIDVWIGEDKLVRRLVQKVTVPAQQGAPGGSAELTLNFRDYGTKLDVAAPPQDEVFDATDLIERALRSAAGGDRGPIHG